MNHEFIIAMSLKSKILKMQNNRDKIPKFERKREIEYHTYNIRYQNAVVLAFNKIESDFFARFFSNFNIDLIYWRRFTSIYR